MMALTTKITNFERDFIIASLQLMRNNKFVSLAEKQAVAMKGNDANIRLNRPRRTWDDCLLNQGSCDIFISFHGSISISVNDVIILYTTTNHAWQCKTVYTNQSLFNLHAQDLFYMSSGTLFTPGGTSFIGHETVTEVLKAGWQVKVVVRSEKQAEDLGSNRCFSGVFGIAHHSLSFSEAFQ